MQCWLDVVGCVGGLLWLETEILEIFRYNVSWTQFNAVGGSFGLMQWQLDAAGFSLM